MQVLRQFGTAILTSIVSIALVIGGLSLALSEQPGPRAPEAIASPAAGVTVIVIPPSPSPSPAPTGVVVFIPSPSPSPAGFSTSTLTGLTATVIACGPPPSWVKTYIVQSGDTLFRIAFNHYTTTPALQLANCKGNSTNINVGERLWVPNVAPRTPGVTVIPEYPTSTAFPTDPLTETSLPFTASPSATNTTVPATQTPLPTITPLP